MKRKFTQQEDDIIRKNYGKVSSKVIAEMVGHPQGSVQWRAKALGVNNRGHCNKKTPEFLSNVLAVVAAADSFEAAASTLGARPGTLQSWINKAKARL